MRLICLLTALLLTTGCATALKRDAHCLAGLTPDYLETQAEAERLEDAWREALAKSDSARGVVARDGYPEVVGGSLPVALLTGAPSGSGPVLNSDRQWAAGQVARAREHFLAARHRMEQTRHWYDRVYRRLQMRIEERQILSQSFMVLAGGGLGALAFYPVVWWNVHSVFWEGMDPDHVSDPVTRYCQERLQREGVSGDGAELKKAAAPASRLVTEYRALPQ